MSDAVLVQGCALSERGIVLWVALPDGEQRSEGRALGVDIGINKMIADSDGSFYGTEFKRLMQKVRSKKRGSKACRRARTERDQYIDRVVKQLPWAELSTIGVEDLKNVKKGKSKKRSKAFRKAVAPWTYRQVLTRIGQKAQENRVHLVAVPPQYTSRTCPKCGVESKGNRKGEKFKCVSCSHSDDSDVVGAQNVLARTLLLDGSLESPSCKKALQ